MTKLAELKALMKKAKADDYNSDNWQAFGTAILANAPALIAAAEALKEFLRIEDEDGTGLVCEAGDDLHTAIEAAREALRALEE